MDAIRIEPGDINPAAENTLKLRCCEIAFMTNSEIQSNYKRKSHCTWVKQMSKLTKMKNFGKFSQSKTL